MFGKTSGYFLLLVLFLDPSSAFIAEKCNIDIDLGRVKKLLNEGKVSLQHVLKAAGTLLGIFKENPNLEKEYPSIKAFVQQLVQQGSKVTAANAAYFGASVYLATVMLTSYCFLVHSQEQFDEARIIDEKLELIIEEEVKPILNYIEKLLKVDQESGLRNACDKKMKVDGMLIDRKRRIQKIAHEVRKLKKQGTKDKKQSKTLKITSGIGAGACIIGIAFMAPTPAGVIVAGAVGAAGVLAHIRFKESELAYEKTLKFLKQTGKKSSEADKAITMLQTLVDVACDFGFKKLESSYRWNQLVVRG